MNNKEQLIENQKNLTKEQLSNQKYLAETEKYLTEKYLTENQRNSNAKERYSTETEGILTKVKNSSTENEEFIMSPKNDFCFKELMQNPEVRQGFISSLLGIDPKDIEETYLLPTIIEGDFPDEKISVLDVRVMLLDKTQINMEMQVKYFEYWDARILFYLSRMYEKQLKQGRSYSNLKKCVHVSILDFKRFEDEECYRIINFRDNIKGDIYTDKMEIQMLELSKIPKQIKHSKDVITWMKFFNGVRKEDFEDVAKENEYVDKAYKILLNLSADEEKRMQYEAREDAIRDYNAIMDSMKHIGLKEGVELGIKEGVQLGKEQGEIKATIEMCKEFNLSKEETSKRLMKKFDISESKADKYLSEYWK